jgi:hypothetical protein
MRVPADAPVAFEQKYFVLAAQVIGSSKSRNSGSDDGNSAHNFPRV